MVRVLFCWVGTIGRDVVLMYCMVPVVVFMYSMVTSLVLMGVFYILGIWHL